MKFLRGQNYNEFLKNRIFRKLTTDFENQAVTKACDFLDVDHKATIPTEHVQST